MLTNHTSHGDEGYYRQRLPACSKADDEGQLFGLLCPLAFAEADAWAIAVLVDKFYTGQLQGAPDRQIV
jgi:hypothetical protein